MGHIFNFHIDVVTYSGDSAASTSQLHRMTSAALPAYKGLRLPEGHPLYNVITVTPAGANCLLCEAHCHTSVWTHLEAKHSDQNLPSRMPPLLNQSIDSLTTHAKQDIYRWKYATPETSVKKKRYCKCCDIVFRDAYNAERHKTSNEAQQFYPESRMFPVSLAPGSSATTATLAPNDTVIPPVVDFGKLFYPLPSIHRNKGPLVDEILKKIVPPTDPPKAWKKVLYPLLAASESWDAFKSDVIDIVRLIDDHNPQSKLDDVNLKKLLEAFVTMEANYDGIDSCKI